MSTEADQLEGKSEMEQQGCGVEQRSAEGDGPRTEEKKKSPVVGYVIAGASLAILFGLAFLKGRVD